MHFIADSFRRSWKATTMTVCLRLFVAGAFLALGILAMRGDANAQANPKLVGQFGDWGVYVNSSGNSRVCFALSQPRERLPANLNRDPGYIFLSTRPGENVRNEFSVIVGYPLNENVDPTVQIGSETFTLYARQSGAWIRNVAEEPRLIDAMRKGSELEMRSTSARGNATTDRYSLSGVTQALERVAQECK